MPHWNVRFWVPLYSKEDGIYPSLRVIQVEAPDYNGAVDNTPTGDVADKVRNAGIVCRIAGDAKGNGKKYPYIAFSGIPDAGYHYDWPGFKPGTQLLIFRARNDRQARAYARALFHGEEPAFVKRLTVKRLPIRPFQNPA